MAGKEHELWILIKAHDEATQAIKKSLRDLEKTINEVVPQVGNIEKGFVRTGTAISRARSLLEKFGIEVKHTRGFREEMASVAKSVVFAVGTWEVMNKFRDLVSYGIEYQKTIENTRIGMAGILSSVAEIRDASGKVLQGQEKWNAALQVSQRIISQLQQENLKTTATFEELLETYRALLGPGMAAGLNVEQIMKLTTVGVNAVKALGLEGRQLVQELRDLVQGGIQPSSSTLATALGITDEDIKRWKEAGTLFQNLMERLRGFQMAANELQGTLSGLLSNLTDIVGQVMQEGTSPLFVAIKEEINSLIEKLAIVKRNAHGAIESITPRPEVIERLRQISREVVNIARAGAQLGKTAWEHRVLLEEVLKLIVAYKSLKWAVNAAAGALMAIRVNPLIAAISALGVAFLELKNKVDIGTLTLKKAGDVIPTVTEQINESLERFRQKIAELNVEQLKSLKIQLLKEIEDTKKRIEKIQDKAFVGFPKLQKPAEIPKHPVELHLIPKVKGAVSLSDYMKAVKVGKPFTPEQRELLKAQEEVTKYQERLRELQEQIKVINKQLYYLGHSPGLSDSILDTVGRISSAINSKLQILAEQAQYKEEEIKTAFQLAKAQLDRLKALKIVSPEDYAESLKALINWETDKEIEIRKKAFQKRVAEYRKLIGEYEKTLKKAKTDAEKKQITESIEQVQEKIRLETIRFKTEISSLEGSRRVQLFTIDTQTMKQAQEEAEKTQKKLEKKRKTLKDIASRIPEISAEIDKELSKTRPLDRWNKQLADVDKWVATNIRKIEKLKAKLEELGDVEGVKKTLKELNTLEERVKKTGEAVRSFVLKQKVISEDPLLGAKKAVEDYQAEIKNTGDYVHDLVKQTLYNIEGLFANRVLDLLEGRAVKIKEIFQSLSKEILSMLVQIGIREAVAPKIADFWKVIFGKKAEGGLIVGGVPNKDSVPILAMPGEYVINKHAVEHYGINFIEALNRMRLPRFAAGGPITPRPAPQPQQQPQTIVIQNTFHATDPISFEQFVRKTGIDRLIAQRVREQLEFG